ncbi:hypothetical protein IJJ49_01105 [Candidatus Saccharibacteria bacterium]|nr:hypothetical protein [Candidatus Saccharibacteria bacterium]
MQRSRARQEAKTAHRQLRLSTTLNRKYVTRPNKTTVAPAKIKRSIKISHFSSSDTEGNVALKKQSEQSTDIRPAKAHPTQIAVNQRLRERRQEPIVAAKPTAKELKDRAIKQALLAAEKQTAPGMAKQIQSDGKVKKRMKFGAGRIVLALSCTAAAIFGLVYFVNLNMPDIQFRAAAMQLNAAYPNYLPYSYSPSEISSENNIVTIWFKKKVTDESFSIIEEKSAWDSNALLNNYVKERYGENYTILREQGLTIYISGSNAAWVNGGIVYKLEMKKGSLSKKQISDIAVSF